MIVDRLKLRGFMACAGECEVELPRSGVVLVTGANGAGKSSIVEAYSYGYFGKTVRGTSPWRAGEAGDVEVAAASLRIRRHRQPSGKVDVWFSDVGEPVAYENATKAQEAISAAVGVDYDVWRRSSVFSSHDAAHFTLATDFERKRLIEAAIGLTAFDDALEACRRDVNAAAEEQRDAAAEVSRLGERVAGAQVRLKDALKVLAEAPIPVDVPALESKAARFKELIAGADRDVARAKAPIREAMQAEAAAGTRLVDAERALKAARGGVCSACGQALPAREQTIQELTTAVADLKSKREAAAKLIGELELQLPALEQEREDVFRLAQENAAKLQAVVADARRRESAEAAVAEARRAASESEGALASQIARVQEAGRRLSVLVAAASVLGPKGVRAQVLSRALSSMEAVANLWLARIAAPGLRLSLKPFTEKKGGGVADAISLEVAGAGGGLGYRASSGGERRRIDVALMLALSEVAVAASGHEPGPLFCDEVFDALDADGVAAVAAALSALGEQRPVVVISHSAELADRLRPALRLHVEGGVVARV